MAISLRRVTWPQRLLFGATLLYVAVFLGLLVSHASIVKTYGETGATHYKDFQNLYQIIPPFFAALCCFCYAWRGVHANKLRRLGWLCIGLGCLNWAAGQFAWTYYETITRIDPWPDSPNLTDYGYLGSYPFLIGGVILLFGSMPLAGRARILLDSAIAASSFGIIAWYFVVSGWYAKSGLSDEAKWTNLSYPLGDIAVLFSVLTLLSGAGSKKTMRRSAILLALGIAQIALGDSLFSYNWLRDTYETGSWFDWAYSFGWLFVAYAALLPLWWPSLEGVAEEPLQATPAREVLRGIHWPTLARVLAPYVAAGASFMAVAWLDYHSNRRISDAVAIGKITDPKTASISLSVLVSGFWLIGLVILRQVLTLLENQHLTAQLRAFNLNLEQKVEERTEQLTHSTNQLAALLALTKAVSSTLKIKNVLQAAGEGIQKALRADAVMLKLFPTESEGLHYAALSHNLGFEERPGALHFLLELAPREEVEAQPLPQDPRDEVGAPGTYLRAPLVWQNKVIGTICAVRWEGDFGTTEAELIEGIGLEVGAALKNAQLYAAAVEAADRDHVTGLYNHRAIHQRLESEFARAERGARPLAVLMMDLNNFKAFNDTYGHPIGDQVLKRVADVLESECRGSDVLGRYGGDEFIAVLPDTDMPLAMVVAQRLRDRMDLEGFRSTTDGPTIPVTLSFGIAIFPDDAKNRYELLTIADANLYTAKSTETGIMGTTETQRAHRQLRAEGSFDVLDAMVTAVDNKDHYTREHSEDVTEYALWLGEELGFSSETMRTIRVAGLLHDVGKIGVPEAILKKPGKLTNEEFGVMKQHPQLGALIVAGVPGMETIVDGVRYHHERWDGNGYPEGLAGDAIPLLGRLLAVADAFSAMTTSRPYRKGLSWDVALEEIRANTGTQFDPTMAVAFLAMANKKRPGSAPALQLIEGNRDATLITPIGANVLRIARE